MSIEAYKLSQKIDRIQSIFQTLYWGNTFSDVKSNEEDFKINGVAFTGFRAIKHEFEQINIFVAILFERQRKIIAENNLHDIDMQETKHSL